MLVTQIQPEADKQAIIAVLDHLSGPSIGLQTLIYSEKLDVFLSPERHITVAAIKPGRMARKDGKLIARLCRSEGAYRLEAGEDTVIWINGREVSTAELFHDDIVEFGEKGPLSRFRLIDSSTHKRRYFSEICDDCWDYTRTSRRSVPARVANAVGAGMVRIASGSTILFRTCVVSLLVLLGFLVYQQHIVNQMQKTELSAGFGRLDDFAMTLARTQKEALTPNDLTELRSGLSRDIDASATRLDQLERKSFATETVINASSSSVLFLQGSYGYRETSSGRTMRHVLNRQGRPLVAPNGAPILSLDGNGPMAERTFTGTGFAIADGSLLVTNRHVAVPWSSKDSNAGLLDRGVEPFMIKLIGYAPGRVEAAELKLLQASENTDLAILSLAPGEQRLSPLPVAAAPVAQGSSVVVLGYPTGLRSMVARSGSSFFEELQSSNRAGFWDIATELSERKMIKPLASLGIVAQSTPEFIVYDAATGRGGSGGPVLNTRGEVIGVTVAIVPDFDGSNLGINSGRLNEFLNQVNGSANCLLASSDTGAANAAGQCDSP